MAKSIIVDNSELNEFVKQFAKVTDSSISIKDMISEVANAYLTDLIAATPVDKGNLKQQWIEDNSNLELKIRETANGYLLELINTTYYASWVEKGHNIKNRAGGPVLGWCMGQFFVKKTEVKWGSGKLDSMLSSRIETWLKNILD